MIIENPDCQLLDPDLIAARETVAQLAAIGGSRKGEISINVTLCANGLDVAASGGKELDDQLRMDLTQACETLAPCAFVMEWRSHRNAITAQSGI